ncbi:MAG: hypothetical protein EBT03_08575 [Betaproteobacteria bacterium]|nr:hypothetical protein [Betaproteobacteria bacterium]NCA16929.1 hypothetical protein [Betaproteobacteria bacterium]
MPRITIEFSDEEHEAAREAMEASRLASALREIDDECRAWIKHGEPAEQERERLEAIRDMVPEIVRE